MKKQKGSILQRMTAVLLAAVLVVGMAWDAAPNTVLAQEDAASSVSDGWQESTEGNTEEPAEGNTKPEEKAPAPAETTNPEEPKLETPKPDEPPKQETPVPEEEPKQETPKPDGETAEQGTVSGNDAQPEIVAAPQSVMMAAEPAPQADNIAQGTDWVLDADGKLTIKTDAGMGDWQVNGLSAYKSDVTSAEIQNGVTSILAEAFYECGSLEKITISTSATSIGNYAFYWCTSLEEITIPEKVTSIGNYAFYNCPKLKSITIPASVTSIGGHAFQSCKGLENITISANVMSIGESAFSECMLLATVTMLGEPPSLGSNVFGEKGEATRVCGFINKNEKGIHVPAGKLQAYQAAWTDWVDYIAEDSASAEEHKHNDVIFTAWTKTDSLPTDAGNYYLTENVTLSDPWHLPGGGETTTLCLNGKTIRTSGTGCVIFIGFANRLNLYDCRDAGKITGGNPAAFW